MHAAAAYGSTQHCTRQLPGPTRRFRRQYGFTAGGLLKHFTLVSTDTEMYVYNCIYIYVTSKNQSSLFGGMETELRQCIETSWSFTLQGVILVQHNSNFVPWKSTFCQRCLCTNLISSQKRFLLKCLSVSSIGRHGGAFKWETPIYKSPYLYTILQTYLLQTSL